MSSLDNIKNLKEIDTEIN